MSRLSLDWLHLLTLLGAVQGVLLAGALFTKRRNRTANRLLAATMLAFSVHLATSVYHAAGLEQAHPHFFGLAHPLPFLYGPLVYLYAVTAADRSRRLSWRDALHLIPFALVVLTGLPVYLMSGTDKLALYHAMLSGNTPRLIRITDSLKIVSGVTYATITLVFLRRHHARVLDNYSSVERVNLRWLVWLGASGAAIWTMALVFEVLDVSGIKIARPGDDFISLAIAAMVYGIGYRGLRQPEIFRYDTAEHRVPEELRAMVKRRISDETRAIPEPIAPMTRASPESANSASRYERSGLSEREAERLKDALLVMMETKRPWQDSDLTLADLAESLATTPHKLSEVINARLGLTFFDFVNGYRVREVQRRIAAGDGQRVTMLSLALDAGFASKSTFNMVFKKHTNQTPSSYRATTGAARLKSYYSRNS
jgi:AraC-like DNA-binding protein